MIPMKYCPRCGKKMEDNFEFCSNCGERVLSPSSSPEPIPKASKERGTKERIFAEGWNYRNQNPVWLKYKDEQLKQYCEVCGKASVPLDLYPVPEIWGNLRNLVKNPLKVITLCDDCVAMRAGKMIRPHELKSARKRSLAGKPPRIRN